VTFRDLEEQTNDALALFGNEEARGIVLLKPYPDYYDEYVERVAELEELFPLSEEWRGEKAIKTFIQLFGSILRLRNILTSFDEFAGKEILSERDYQDYQSLYLDYYSDLRRAADSEKESIIDDVVFEIELVKQVEVNVDYILMLVEQYREERGDGTDREIETLAKIRRAIDSSVSLRKQARPDPRVRRPRIRRRVRQRRLASLRRSQARRGARLHHRRRWTRRRRDPGVRRESIPERC
jgi:type I restriction enzyme, R subunit